MKPELRIPRATYRLQFHRGFTFRDAIALVPYLADLGISHLYCSPYLRARSGSTHGYDIVDHQSLNPEIGTREEFDRLVAELDAHGMGQILDVVPNHMGIMGADNAWWLDVLENGQSSAFADFFDIDWHPAASHLRNRVLVPVLGDHYGAVLARGELVLGLDAAAGAFNVQYHEHRFPIDPQTCAVVLRHAASLAPAGAAAGLEDLAGAFAGLPDRDDTSGENSIKRSAAQPHCKQRLAALCREDRAARHAVEEAIRFHNGSPDRAESFDALHELLERQAYRLAYWRVALDEINYRRFFDINDLAALRMENETVFEATHEFIFELVGKGAVHALRIDHPDGLLDPAAYFDRLQQRFRQQTGAAADERLYVVAEKIIAPFENLPGNWNVDGTTGYRFANVVNGLFVDGAAERRFTRVYEAFTGERASFGEIARASKRLVLRTALASELTVLSARLERIARADRLSRDYTLNTLRQALVEIVAAFPVYRTYIAEDISPEDRRYIDWAVARARRHSPAADPSIFDFVRSVLSCEAAGSAPAAEVRRFARKFQQLTAPVTAKGVEDTAFYSYNRLLSLNDVGSDPSEFGYGVSAFHGASADRAASWPHTMLATSTHDNKRSEDVRTRIDVLSEATAAWKLQLRRWARMNRSKKRKVDDRLAPGRNDEYLLYQTLVGSFPAEPHDLSAYRERIQAYMLKALREAKVESSWINPNADYEAATRSFVDAVLSDSGRNLFLEDLREVLAPIAWLGMLNSLSLVLIKLTSPGVPDIYQGNELWDLSLVDPDNRRPVDYALRRELLAGLMQTGSRGMRAADLFARPADGRAKLYYTWRLLALRREWPDVFLLGDYTPIQAEGTHKAHVVAYARRHADRGIIAIGGRLFATLGITQSALPCGEAVWKDTRIALPFLEDGTELTDALSGNRTTVEQGTIAMARAWGELPGAVLTYEAEKREER
ncbi:MAG TPA: malto-oligosyltrehalose synthase [Burkholderiales bacterium]